MTKGVKLIILLVLGIVGIGLILYFALFRLKEPVGPVSTTIEKEKVSLPIAEKNLVRGKDSSFTSSLGATTTVVPLDTENNSIGSEDLARKVFSFVERFGSFSSESQLQNIADLEIFMTDSMKKWALEYRTANSFVSKTYRITTKALVVKESEILENEGKATFLITTQRDENNGEEKKIFYQNIEAQLILEGNEWKFNSAYWK